LATLFRKNQEAVAIALGRIMEQCKEPADITTSEASLDFTRNYIILN